jgi:hypothetical protein
MVNIWFILPTIGTSWRVKYITFPATVLAFIYHIDLSITHAHAFLSR